MPFSFDSLLLYIFFLVGSLNRFASSSSSLVVYKRKNIVHRFAYDGSLERYVHSTLFVLVHYVLCYFHVFALFTLSVCLIVLCHIIHQCVRLYTILVYTAHDLLLVTAAVCAAVCIVHIVGDSMCEGK